jgi:hypothetical protein
VLAAVLVGGMALVTSACGSKPAPKTTTQAGGVFAPDSAAADRGLLTRANCSVLINLPVAFENALTGVGVDMTREHAVLMQFASRSLPDLRPDFVQLATAAKEITTRLKGVDLGGNGTPSASEIAKVRAVSDALGTTSLTDASSYVATWAQQHCAKS